MSDDVIQEFVLEPPHRQTDAVRRVNLRSDREERA
jgi:hypothetical protein